MTSFFKQQQIGPMASVVTSLMLVSGCKNASVNNGPSLVPGGVGTPSIYRSYPQPARPYSEDMNQLPSTQPAPPATLPVPGYSEPEVPPAPSAQRSRWNFLPPNFKMPSLGRQSSDVHQTAAKSDEHGIGAIFKKNKSGSPTLRDDVEVGEVIEEVVHSRSSATSNLESSVENQTSETPIYSAEGANSNLKLTPTIASPIKSVRKSTLKGSDASNFDVPQLAPPVTPGETVNSTDEVPRLLTPNK